MYKMKQKTKSINIKPNQMIKKLKLLPMGVMCLLVTCILGLSLNAQSSTAESSQLTLSSYLQQMKNLDTQEQSLLSEPLTDKVADRLELLNQRRAELIANHNANIAKKSTQLTSQKIATKSKFEKARELNEIFMSEGRSARAIVVESGGENHIQLIKTTEDNFIGRKN